MSSLMPNNFTWEPQPETAKFVQRLVQEFVDQSSMVASLQKEMHQQTGTRLVDWIDHLVVNDCSASDLDAVGYVQDEHSVWHNDAGIFPMIRLSDRKALAIKVESVEAFVNSNRFAAHAQIEGDSGSLFRTATISQDSFDFVAVERHGYQGFDLQPANEDWRSCLQSFVDRPRSSAEELADFSVATERFAEIEKRVGTDCACDLFFAAERSYWMRRNQAARVQKQRQDSLGLGWANHDHHTYRCSRELFAPLIRFLERMGFHCRERFYAGEEAGWGAQVLEQRRAGVIIFADVDLTPDEVAGDFAHEGLAARHKLGTVGLWCKLHGDSFLAAGMHHLECQFDFDAARSLLAEAGIETMAPFTDFPFLRQAFTKGENWSVDSHRLQRLLDAGSITQSQHETFSAKGAIGSHMEILERNDGFKGFNQTGISHIIHKTDPRGIGTA